MSNVTLVGTRPGPYRPRKPVYFHAPPGAQVLTGEAARRQRGYGEVPQCAHCERQFIVFDEMRSEISVMCCTIACSNKHRGYIEPSPLRAPPAFNRWSKKPEETAIAPSPEAKSDVFTEVASPQEG